MNDLVDKLTINKLFCTRCKEGKKDGGLELKMIK